jgi:glycosyltransferase involved in cell wall biosynthesis
MTKISIVTVSLNAAPTIERAIQSVLSQGYPGLEYLIVDGGSTDGTRQLIEEHLPSLAYYYTGPDRGISDAFNHGISRATGDLIGIVSADDFLPPGSLARAAHAWDEHGHPDVLSGSSLVLYPGEAKPRLLVRPDEDFRRIWRRTPLKHSSMFVSRAAYQKLGGYDLRWHLAMDYELILRFFFRGARFAQVDEVLGAFQLGGVNEQLHKEARQEFRRISLEYGCPHIIADFWYIVELIKAQIRRRLEGDHGKRLRAYRTMSRRFSQYEEDGHGG